MRRLVQNEHTCSLRGASSARCCPYRQTLGLDPKDMVARLQIGTIYARNGIDDVALREFEAILAQDPKHASLHNNRGNLYFARGDYERALDGYRRRRAPIPRTAASA